MNVGNRSMSSTVMIALCELGWLVAIMAFTAYSSHQDEANVLKQEVAALSEEVGLSENGGPTRTELEAILAATGNELSEAQESLAKTEEERAGLARDLVEQSVELEGERAQIAKHEHTYGILSEEYANAKARAEVAEVRLEGLSAQVAQGEELRNAIDGQLADRSKKLNVAFEQLADAEDAYSVLSQERDAAHARANEAKALASQLREKYAAAYRHGLALENGIDQLGLK